MKTLFQSSTKHPEMYEKIKGMLPGLLKRGEYNSPVVDFPKDLQWFNSSPLSFSKELKGKLVLMDFWTSCCINCL